MTGIALWPSLPCRQLRWPQAVARQNPFMQALQLLHQQRVHIRTIGLRHGFKCLFNYLERVGLRRLHHLAHRLLDQVAVSQAQLVGLGQGGGAVGGLEKVIPTSGAVL